MNQAAQNLQAPSDVRGQLLRAADGATTPVMESSEERYLTIKDLAKRLHCCTRTVGNWMRDGTLPYFKVGRAVRFKWTDVEGQLRKKNLATRKVEQ